MSDKVNYNIIEKDISNGLDNVQISGGKDYLILLEAPIGANVTLKLGSNEADAIPLPTDYSIEFDKTNDIYISSDAVSGGRIKIGVSDTTTGGIKIYPNPVLDQVSTIGEVTELSSISTALNVVLDKIINPYQLPTITQGESNSTSLTTLLSKTLTCDKITLDIMGGYYKNNAVCYQYGNIQAILNGKIILANGGRASGGPYLSTGKDGKITIENCYGQNLIINCTNSSSSFYSFFILQEFILKS